jgi:hypothetical protein
MGYEVKSKAYHRSIGNDLGEVLLEKEAKVTGSSGFGYPAESLINQGIPYDTRKTLYMDYANRKAQEPKTGYPRAVGTGAAIGGVLGGLSGIGNRKAMALGAGVGAVTGGIIGAVVKNSDDREIAESQQAIRSPEAADRILAVRMARAHQYEKAQDRSERRANTMILADAIRPKSGRR